MYSFNFASCESIRVVLQSGYLFKKLHSSPVLTVEAYFDFKVFFAKTLIRVRSTYSNKEKVRINQLFKKIYSFVMILSKIAVSFGFSQILCSSITREQA